MQGADLAQHAVDAIADAQEIGFRLEVNVDASRLTASVRIESIRRTTGWLYSSSVADNAFPVDLAGFDFLQDAVDRQFVTVILVDGAVDFGFAGDQRIDLDVFWSRCGPGRGRRCCRCRRSPGSAGGWRDRNRAAAGGGAWPCRAAPVSAPAGRRPAFRSILCLPNALGERLAQCGFRDESRAKPATCRSAG
jgi:hypothetical protein